MTNIKAIRGMHDILPGDMADWQHVECVMRTLMAAYAYQEIRFPLLEQTALFSRSVGEQTDIVAKEMYSFADRHNESMTLRPEGTAGCVRAALEHSLLYKQTQRLWYLGPMFRYERPQKGRSRQFHQLGVEALGMPGPDIDAEIIAMSARLWRTLGVDKQVHLQLNTLGTPQSRQAYRSALVDYLNQHTDALDEDSQRRLSTNPLRILDSKNPAMQAIIKGAPNLLDHLDDESRDHFAALQAQLDALQIPYEINPHLVRGLDYYTKTVFEWVSGDLGAQNTVCAGGRYDGLVAQLGGQSTPGVGFALGLERLIHVLHSAGQQCQALAPHAYLVVLGEAAQQAALALAEQLRDALPALRLCTHAGAGSAKSQFKRADKSGAHFALVLGDDELAQDHITVKDLRGDENAHVNLTDLVALLRRHT